jgi:glycosyltransferase involved in cell wall biosynthesis
MPQSSPTWAYWPIIRGYLIAAAYSLKAQGEAVYFLVMGYPRVEQYRALAEQAGVADRMIFTGKIEYQNAPEHLRTGDIAISAKLSNSEGSGKVLNYMAMGQPVVAYDTPVHREYLAEWGAYAPAGDVEGLAQAVATLAHDPGRRQALGARLRERAIAEYSWQAAVRGIVRLYERLTGLKTGSTAGDDARLARPGNVEYVELEP